MDAGSLLGDTFRIEEPLGEGGFGAVYAARHVRTSKRYAVKVLHPDRAKASPDAVARFRREAEALAELGHPGIVAIHDFAQTDDGIDYLVMDLLKGEDLSERINRDGPLSWEKALALLKPIAAALGVAHRAGIVHRDLKPGNIFVVTADGVPDRPMILDFGLVKFADQRPDEPLTASGVVMGTPAYLSPEQALGQDLDHRTDLYALATLFYELLTGATPFEATTMTALLLKIMTAPPPPLSTRARVPPHVDKVMARALAKDVDDRFDSAAAFVEALEKPGLADAGDEVGHSDVPLLQNAPTMRAEPALTPEAIHPTSPPPNGRRFPGVAVAIAVLVAVTLVAGGVWAFGTDSRGAHHETPAIARETVAQAPVESPPVSDLVPDPQQAEPEEARVADMAQQDDEHSDGDVLEHRPARRRSRPTNMGSSSMSDMNPTPANVSAADMTPNAVMDANPALSEANRVQIVRYQAQVSELERFLGILPRLRREVSGLARGQRPALCESPVRSQLTQHSDVAIVLSKAQSLRDAVQRICEPFEQLIDPPPAVRTQLRRIDSTLDRAEQMAEDRTISTNVPVAVAAEVAAAIRDARGALQGVSEGRRPFPCDAPVFSQPRRLSSGENTWSGAAAQRVVRLRDGICRRIGMDGAQLRQHEAQFLHRLDDSEGALRQTQRTLQRVIEQYEVAQ